MDNRSVIYKSNIDLQNKNSARALGIDLMPKNGAVVLDVGCACGDLGVALKEHRNATMFGLEYNQGSIDIALETGAYEEIHQFNLDEITENSFPQYKGKFDYVVCGDVLEHLRNPMYSLNILKSYLKDDGKVIASIPNVAHMSIKSNLLVNDFTYTPLGLLDETHIHLFTHKSIALGLSSIGLKVDACKFTLQRKVAWQPNDPYPQLSDDMKDYLFKDWHSYVCQYVMSISCSEQNGEELFNHNIKKLNIDENNAPENIKNYRTQILAELTNTTAKKLDNGLSVLKNVEGKIELCSEIKAGVVAVAQNQKDNGLLLKELKNDVLSVRNTQANNIEVVKGQFNDLKSQTAIVDNKLTAISNNQQNIQTNIISKLTSFDVELEHIKSDISNIPNSLNEKLTSIEDKSTILFNEIASMRNELSKKFNEKVISLENTLSSIKNKNSQETSTIKQQLSNLEHKIAKEKEFALREAALRDKIQDLKERRRFYKNLTALFFLLFVGLLSYILFF